MQRTNRFDALAAGVNEVFGQDANNSVTTRVQFSYTI